ncbi:putative lipase LipH [Streptomyces spiroverticillatus]|uniref:Lipase LipH n=1 Tax=Streptomyces finlayi TaxID=67296 RepID=A0A918X3J2_9ACTN|nr:alpha/beta hydrolase [Streptomyces finlayi]GHA27715.1 putative lipase LipH [Streptomyces spiroverticillatus]GHD08765.1 putative lipase LipH [Streptomyces finlayi]
MPIEPALEQFLDQVPQLDWSLDPVSFREQSAARLALLPVTTPLPKVEDGVIPGPGGEIPVRFYHPSADPDLPVTVFCHGGGFVIGDLESHDALCRTTAKESGSIVMAVDYRLSPEHAFPAALEDGFAAYVWAREHAREWGGDPSRIALAGDSAGASITAGVCLMARDRGVPQPVLQLLWYPATGLDETPSRKRFADAAMLGAQAMAFFHRHHFGAISRREAVPYGAVSLADDLSGLAPAYVLVAGNDPLLDEGIAYAGQLRAAGVPTQLDVQEEMVHGFLNFADLLPSCRAAAQPSLTALREALRH